MSVLTMWTVYEHPYDYPDKCVARRWQIGGKGELLRTDSVMVADSLEPIRAELEAWGLYCMPRAPGDEPQIVETWF